MKRTLLPTPFELKQKLVLTDEIKQSIQKNQLEIKQIFKKEHSKLVLILGPCSFHQTKDILYYGSLFQKLSEQVSKNIFLILRVFSEKSRTGSGWKGFLYDPSLDNSHDIERGIIETRKLLLQLNQMNIPCSMEFVDPIASLYFDDLISWGFIGARTSSSQTHRQFASSLNIPIGFKNTTNGNIDPALQGILCSQKSQSFIGMNEDGKVCKIQSHGNPYSHLVLRGSDHGQNYDFSSISNAVQKLKHLLITPKIIVDCSHGNSQKNHNKQIHVLQNVAQQVLNGNSHILGMMLESFLYEGNQTLSQTPQDGLSVTDPCIDWETTSTEVLKLHALLEDNVSSDKICFVQN